MEMVDKWLLSDEVLIVLLHVATLSILVAAVVLLATRLLRKFVDLPTRHGILGISTFVLLVCPVLFGLGRAADIPAVISPDRRGKEAMERDHQAERSSIDHQGVELVVASPPSQGKSSAPTDVTARAPGGAQQLVWPRRVATLLAYLWLVGILAATARMIQGFRLGWLLRRTAETPNEPIRSLAEAAAAEFHSTAKVFISRRLPAPVSLGLMRPCVILPADIGAVLDNEQLRGVLIHEHAHIRRFDLWLGLIGRLSTSLFWWNPLVHRVTEQLGATREQLCDDIVASRSCGTESYALALMELAARAAGCTVPPVGVGVLPNGRPQLEGRLQRLLEPRRQVATSLSPPSLAAVLFFGAAMAALPVFGQVAAQQSTARSARLRASDSKRVARAIPLVYADGPGVVVVLKETARAISSQGPSSAGRADDLPNAVSIGHDAQSNCIILMARKDLCRQLEKLVRRLETLAERDQRSRTEAANDAPTARPSMDQQVSTGDAVKYQVHAGSQRITMKANRSKILFIEGTQIPRVLVDNPDLVNAMAISPSEIQLAARKPGVTNVNLWDSNAMLYSIEVVVYGDARELELLLEAEFPDASLRVRQLSTSLVLSGWVERPETVERVVRIAEDYAAKVINNIRVRHRDNQQLLKLLMREAELSETHGVDHPKRKALSKQIDLVIEAYHDSRNLPSGR